MVKKDLKRCRQLLDIGISLSTADYWLDKLKSICPKVCPSDIRDVDPNERSGRTCDVCKGNGGRVCNTCGFNVCSDCEAVLRKERNKTPSLLSLVATSAKIDTLENKNSTYSLMCAILTSTFAGPDQAQGAKDGLGNVQVLELLLKAGVDPNTMIDTESCDTTKSPCIKRPLVHMALVQKEKQLEVVRLLIKMGASLDLKDTKRCQRTFLYTLIKVAPIWPDACTLVQDIKDRPEIVQQLNQRCGKHGDTPLHVACKTGAVTAVETLINMQADMQVKNDHGCPPLLACFSPPSKVHTHTNNPANRTKIIEKLLDAKADPTQSDNQGTTLLHLACGKNSKEDVELLLKIPAVQLEVLEKPSGGKTPLLVACSAAKACSAPETSANLIKALVNAKANCTVRDEEDNTVLHASAAACNTDVLNILHDALKDDEELMQGVNKKNETAAVCACLSSKDSKDVQLDVSIGEYLKAMHEKKLSLKGVVTVLVQNRRWSAVKLLMLLPDCTDHGWGWKRSLIEIVDKQDHDGLKAFQKIIPLIAAKAHDAKGRNIIHVAATKPSDRMLQSLHMLVQHGWYQLIHEYDANGLYPQHLAGKETHAALLDLGAKKGTPTKDGRKRVDIRREIFLENMPKFLLKDGKEIATKDVIKTFSFLVVVYIENDRGNRMQDARSWFDHLQSLSDHCYPFLLLYPRGSPSDFQQKLLQLPYYCLPVDYVQEHFDRLDQFFGRPSYTSYSCSIILDRDMDIQEWMFGEVQATYMPSWASS